MNAPALWPACDCGCGGEARMHRFDDTDRASADTDAPIPFEVADRRDLTTPLLVAWSYEQAHEAIAEARRRQRSWGDVRAALEQAANHRAVARSLRGPRP